MGRIPLDDAARILLGGSTQLAQQNAAGSAEDEKHQTLVLKLKYWALDLNAMFAELYSLTSTPFLNVVNPTTLATTQDNYFPDGAINGTTNRHRLMPAAGGSTITSWQAPPSDGFLQVVINTSNADVINFEHMNSSGAAGAKILCANNLRAVLPVNGWATMIYDSGFWRIS